VPVLTGSVSVPRLVAIEYPLGRTLGQPGDAAGQMAVLRAVLQALTTLSAPGQSVHLPFQWPEAPKDVHNEPPEAPPITRHIISHPWQLPRLLNRNVPSE
jgi:hypothetical protein